MINRSIVIGKPVALLVGTLIGWNFPDSRMASTEQASDKPILGLKSERGLATEKVGSSDGKRVLQDKDLLASDAAARALTAEELESLPRDFLNDHISARLERLFEKYVERGSQGPDSAEFEDLHKRIHARTRELFDHELRGSFSYETPKGQVVVEFLKQSMKNPVDPTLKNLPRDERLAQECFFIDLSFQLVDERSGEVLRKHEETHYPCAILRMREGKVVTTTMIHPSETPYFGHFLSYDLPTPDFVSDVEVIPDHQEHKPISGKIVWIVRDDSKGDGI